EDGLEVVGFYHSHPDHPARPSSFDRDHAWPWYSYGIVPATSSGAGAPRAWRLRDDRSRFDEQEITL
ncbi:MAG TPA: Mov34/MPN/PAD-1 family protein, partial [Longimicrobiaceae bacterium]|nr:Mov34/MPN/PAD-1 family protein [Longimicrobiaceae bacterium]